MENTEISDTVQEKIKTVNSENVTVHENYFSVPLTRRKAYFHGLKEDYLNIEKDKNNVDF